jgi:2-dehydro-3-deoxyphosphogluconate aldolase/(4S)-4-hydroxy-2-oxoglutarate aldolase
MKESLIKILSDSKIFPVLRCNKAALALDTAKALIDGGVKILEVNVENSSIYGVIEKIASDVIVCAGGIITSIQANAAVDSGAKVLSSPIFQMNMVKISKDKEIPFIAGATTANEAYEAWKARVQVVKVYPITAMGGTMYLEDLLRPMPFLRVMPLGQVKLDEVQSYIDAGAIAVGVGRDLYDGYSYSEITKRVKGFIHG